MQLIGMLDSPYVRRVAISLQLLELPFEHRSVSVFSTFAQFQEINPVVKAPTLICDDGSQLMDSTLILDYAETLAAGRRSLMPTGLAQRRQTLRRLGLALAAGEKTMQIAYENNLRPAEKRHEPWVVRVTGQLLAAYAALEAELVREPMHAGVTEIDQAGVTSAVVWRFTQMMLPGLVDAAHHPALQGFSEQAETLAPFLAAPYGTSTYRHQAAS